ncbi:hypothetical protein GDO81_028344 [Engystomops pustulosus]|uniref:Uncharacterized protein n=1 Tax=Engystomops pustulosus TaxID=76066 RepID=A0AAV6YLA5_ENGPU|nr:hypothetical protein GDO81_028344 [Engystomops pustulosus]
MSCSEEKLPDSAIKSRLLEAAVIGDSHLPPAFLGLTTVIFGFFFTSLTKAPLPQLLSLAGGPGRGKIVVVPSFFHLKIKKATVLLGTLSAAEILL